MSKHLFPKLLTDDGMVIEVKLVQLEKHPSPKLVTDDGMVIEVKLLQSEKHQLPKLVTNDGMVIEAKFLQNENALLVDYQYYTLKTVEKWQNRFCVDTKNVRFNVFNFWLHQNHIDMDWMESFEPTP